MNKNIIQGAVAVIFVIIFAMIIFRSPAEGPKGGEDTSYDSPEGGAVVESDAIRFTASINQPVAVGELTLTVLDVTEDSRCPSDVQCIQAGRVIARVQIASAAGTSITEIEPSTTVAADGFSVSLVSVTPYPVSTSQILDADYRFSFVASRR